MTSKLMFRCSALVAVLFTAVAASAQTEMLDKLVTEIGVDRERVFVIGRSRCMAVPPDSFLRESFVDSRHCGEALLNGD